MSKWYLYKQMFFVFIPITDNRRTSVFECPCDFRDFMPKQEDLNMSSERYPEYQSLSVKVPVPYGIPCRERNHELYDEMSIQVLADYKAMCDSKVP